MGLLSKLGGAIKESIRVGVVKGITKGLKDTSEGKLFGDKYDELLVYNKDISGDSFASNLVDGRKNNDVVSNGTATAEYDNLKKRNGTKNMNSYNEEFNSSNVIKSDENSDILNIEIPDWGYDDFINERGMWQKQITTAFGDPGFFYFKIFFKFDTQHGLFGGLLNDADFTYSINSAAKFLYIGRKQYAYLKPIERIDALFKFASILSYISSSAPWYFTSVKGLNDAIVPTLNDFSKERVIEIGISPDAIDMRLSTLLSLYKFACYDDITNKEIVPENLRKFDMSVVIFAAPIRHLHTSMIHNIDNEIKSFKYKSLVPEPTSGDDNGWSNVMSYKMITFKNCEIMVESLSAAMTDNAVNEKPFQLGGNSIRIKYDKAYEHTMNEFYSVMFGSGGMLYNQFSVIQNEDATVNKSKTNTQAERLEALQAEINNTSESTNTDPIKYKTIIDASEALITNRLMNYDNMALGNIYTEESTVSKGYSNDNSNQLHHNGLNDYYKAKLKYLHNRLNLFSTVGGNVLLNLLNSSWTSADTLGNLYGDVGVGSPYWKNKLKKLHNKEHKDSDVAEFYNDYQNVMNFDLRDFMFSTSRGNKGS